MAYSFYDPAAAFNGYVEGPVRSFPFAGDIPKYSRVAFNAANGCVEAASALEQSIGVTKEATYTENLGSGEALVDVILRAGNGTRPMIASAAFDVGLVYGAAAGKVSGTPNGNCEGYALNAGVDTGDWVEVIPLPQPSAVLGNGSAIACGIHTTVEAVDDAITTGLSYVNGAACSMQSAPTANAAGASAIASGTVGCIEISTWKSDLVTAASVFSKQVSWIAFGHL